MENLSCSQKGGPTSYRVSLTNQAGSPFRLDTRYQILQVIGAGAYGVVVSAKDTSNNTFKAIKKIQKAFDDVIFTKRTLRELKFLRLLQHQNIMKIQSIQLPNSPDQLHQIYVISQLMQSDLGSVIKGPSQLSDLHVKVFLYQLLKGLQYIHKAAVIHRDLKPHNLLVNSNCDLKICDFGLAKAVLEDTQLNAHQMTDYVATR